MSDLRPERPTPSEFRRISVYGLAYLLWALSFFLGGLALLQFRDALLAAVVVATFNRTQANPAAAFYAGFQARAADQWTYLVAGIVMVVLIVGLEHFYRSGVQPGLLRLRFFQVTAIEFIVLLVSDLTSAIMVWVVAAFTWRSLFYPILELICAVIFVWLWLESHRKIGMEGQPA